SLVDQPAALFGQGCIDRGDVKATFGTGCFVYANTGALRPAGGDTLATIAWQRTGAPICYALDGGVLAFGSAISWLRSLGMLGGRGGRTAPHDDLDRVAATRTEVTCVPALVGLAAPHWDRDVRAAWLGMTSVSSPDELAAALVEGIACRVVEVVRAVERDA